MGRDYDYINSNKNKLPLPCQAEGHKCDIFLKMYDN